MQAQAKGSAPRDSAYLPELFLENVFAAAAPVVSLSLHLPRPPADPLAARRELGKSQFGNKLVEPGGPDFPPCKPGVAIHGYLLQNGSSWR